uniref:Uncharacterized protein LOC114342523 n=1 Tax=Diabrotica virgifera virgifera TaxID=50390 RepID=A0A6P7GZB9_DIAVI
MEIRLQKPLHWFICLLHFNELPLRHLYDTLEKSVTKGPRALTGGLIEKLNECEKYQVLLDFEPIPLDNMPPPLENEEELSVDVKYLLQMGHAISQGFCSADLANKKPGQISHARWLTKASRILRLYVTTKTPSHNLKTLTNYIMKVYIPLYFNIQFYKSVIYGSILLSKFIRWTQYLNGTLRSVVQNVLDL